MQHYFTVLEEVWNSETNQAQCSFICSSASNHVGIIGSQKHFHFVEIPLGNVFNPLSLQDTQVLSNNVTLKC